MLGEVRPAQRPLVAITLLSIDRKDAKVTEAAVPALLEGLRPRIAEQSPVSIPLIHKALEVVGQPAVDAIFKVFDSISYQGGESATYRQNLFDALATLGPACKSQPNYDQVKLLYKKEGNKYKSVSNAAVKAVREMDPR
jgi:hypothetical protein